MTKSAGEADAGERGPRRTCRWCQRPVAQPGGAGRPRQYCQQSCRQQAFLARKLAAAHGLGDDDVIVPRADLEALQDRIALLRHAIGDIERELAASGDRPDHRGAYAWLHAHALEVTAGRLEPVWTARP